MRAWPAKAAAGLLLLVAVAGCRNPLGRQYEYEEQIYLRVDGSASVVIDTSMPALYALRGLPVDPSFRTPVDRDQIRRLYSTAGCDDVRVGQPWIRKGRRFIQIRLQTRDVTRLSSCRPLSWSTYTFEKSDGAIRFEQTVGAAAKQDPGAVRWDGSELVAFKLHLPSRILYHNVRNLEDGSVGSPDRGNILTWEQRLADRRTGQAVHLDVRMDAQSILYRTLWLFAGAFAAALALVATLVWITIRRARRTSTT